MSRNPALPPRTWFWIGDTYGEQLNGIRSSVKRLYEQDAREQTSIPYFTPHDDEHCDRVEKRIHDLIPDEYAPSLTEKEQFFLLAAAWLHDVGQLKTVAKTVSSSQLTDEEIRRQHHVFTDEYISKHWAKLGIDNQTDAGTLAKICRYHRRVENIMDCEQNSGLGQDEVRVRLLAAYLRIADALDIGPGRTPQEAYMVCLTYDIPDDPRLHWIKSRMVRLVSPDPKKHTITIEFLYPYEKQLKTEIGDPQCKKVDRLIQSVVGDLQDELTSVISTLTREGPVYYLDIIPKPFKHILNDTLVNDLREIVINFDVVTAPSASKLLEVILVSVANILGYSLHKVDNPRQISQPQAVDFLIIQRRLKRFLTDVEVKISAARSCHLGLTNLIAECKRQCLSLENVDSIEPVVLNIDKLYKAHLQSRQDIRIQSAKLFQHVLSKRDREEQTTVLLYGHSELVTKSVCGLRDYLIRRRYTGTDPTDVYGGEKEKLVSESIRLFICEGQPKTQTSYNDRLIYHDGSQYALHLAQRGFNNINLIPDIIAGTVIAEDHIDYVLIGANGITEEYFMHCAGHRAIVDLARSQARRDNTRSPLIVLVTSREKVMLGTQTQQTRDAMTDITEVEGNRFRRLEHCSANRTHMWMCKDKQLLKDLREIGACFVNPREDKIPIDNINYILSDVGWKEITSSNAESVVKDLFGSC